MSTEKAAYLFAITFALLGAGAAASASADLDGRSFIGPTGPRGEAAERADERVEFKAGRFRSSLCEEMGFPAAPYRATRKGEEVRFESLLASEDDGSIHWVGVVRGERIEATYTWTKEGVLWTTRREYWFKGSPLPR